MMRMTYLEQRPERSEKSNVLGKVGKQPQVVPAERQYPYKAEYDDPKDNQPEDENQETSCSQAQVVHPLPVGFENASSAI
jgi:hypothetical protein